MNELASANVALASLLALSLWARTAPTRAWGDGAPASHRYTWAVVLGTVAGWVPLATCGTGMMLSAPPACAGSNG